MELGLFKLRNAIQNSSDEDKLQAKSKKLSNFIYTLKVTIAKAIILLTDVLQCTSQGLTVVFHMP